jgi:hypothetical protein
MNFEPIQINSNVKVRESDWIQVCPNCQHERVISYPQAWNLKKGHSKKECKSCQIELGLCKINTEGLKLAQTKEGQKYSASNRIGIKRPIMTEVLKYRQLFNPDSFTSEESRKKQRKAKLGKRGAETNNWQGGKKEARLLAKSQDAYKQWRFSVFSRDKFLCIHCGSKKQLEADHIKEWCNYPELRYEITNGRTLCHSCHKKTDNYGHKAIKKKVK